MILFESGSGFSPLSPALSEARRPQDNGGIDVTLTPEAPIARETAPFVQPNTDFEGESTHSPLEESDAARNAADSSMAPVIDLPNFHKGRPPVYTKKGVELPYIDSDIFDGHRSARQMVALLAIEGNIAPGMAYAHQAARRLRYKVYSQLGWIGEDKKDSDGGESDKYDARSVHLAAIANTPHGPLLHGGIRLILSHKDEKLPVEDKYGMVAEDGATELSRLIFQHPDKRMRTMTMFGCFRATIGTGLNLDYKVAYGMVEPYLPQILTSRKLAHTLLTDYTPTPEYGNTDNALLYVDPHKLLEGTRLRRGAPLLTSLFFRNTLKGNGLGYYRDSYCLVRQDEQVGVDSLIQRYRRSKKTDTPSGQPHWPDAA